MIIKQLRVNISSIDGIFIPEMDFKEEYKISAQVSKSRGLNSIRPSKRPDPISAGSTSSGLLVVPIIV